MRLPEGAGDGASAPAAFSTSLNTQAPGYTRLTFGGACQGWGWARLRTTVVQAADRLSSE